MSELMIKFRKVDQIILCRGTLELVSTHKTDFSLITKMYEKYFLEKKNCLNKIYTKIYLEFRLKKYIMILLTRKTYSLTPCIYTHTCLFGQEKD